MQSALTPSADSAARDYYAREKYRSRLCLGGVSLGLAVLGCCAALLPGLPVRRRYPGHRPGLCRTARPALPPPAPVPRQGGQLPTPDASAAGAAVYPGCGYCLLGSREIQRRLREPSDGIFSGGLGEYGGTLSWPSPRGAVLAHDLTENCPGGSVRDWVVYEYPLPADSPWRQVSYAQIRCLRTPAPEQTGSPLTASALGSHRSPAPWSALRAGWAIPRSCCVPTVRNSAGRSSPMGQPNRCCASSGRWTARLAYPLFLPGKPLCLCPGQPPGSALEPPGRALSRGDPPEHRRCLPDSAADPAPGRLTSLPLTQCFLPPFPQCPVRLL